MEIKNGHLIVRDTAHKGRGVFTLRKIRKGEVIELCPVIELSQKEHDMTAGQILEHYVFEWDNRKQSVAILFGFGSIYNHSSRPNAAYKKMLKQRVMKFVAEKDIPEGGEITVDYGEENSRPDRDALKKTRELERKQHAAGKRG